MTDPQERRENNLAVSRGDVVFRQDDPEEDDESLAVGRSNDCGGGEEGAATERLAGQFVDERHLTLQS